MNASAYLHNQGWRGEGHSLDRTNRGLAKPLLVSQKSDLAGVGNKKNDFANQWWSVAFDKSLKDFGSDTREFASLQTSKNRLIHQRSLYANFVRSEPLRGTIAEGFARPTVTATDGSELVDARNSIMPSTAQSIAQFGVLGVPPGEVVETVSAQHTKAHKKSKSKGKEDSGAIDSVPEQQTKSSKKKRNKEEPKKEKSEKHKARKEERRKEMEEKRLSKEQRREERRRAAESNGNDTRSEVQAEGEKEKSKKRKRDVEAAEPATPEIGEKARKRSKESGAEVEGHSKKNRDSQTEPGALQRPAADFISLNVPMVSNVTQKGVKSKKETAKEIRARRKADKAAKARERVGIKRQKQVLELAAATATPSTPDPAKELRRPLHPESILALRETGQTVQLPGDNGDEDQWRFQLIKAIESGITRNIKTILDRAAVKFQATELTDLKATSKKAKIKREAYKRKIKTEAKKWVDIRASQHLHRPDGTYIPPRERGVPEKEIQAHKQAEAEARKQAMVEKKAELARKAQEKIERRAAKQQRRMERLHRLEQEQLAENAP